jgi:hypothetical protein
VGQPPTGAKIAAGQARNFEGTADGIKATFKRGMGKGKMQRQVATLTKKAEVAENVSKFMEGASFVFSAKDAIDNVKDCEAGD